MALEYFPFYYSYRKKLAKLSDQEVGRLVRSLLEYGETGETEELTGRESVAFDFIADDIDRAKSAYDEKCSKNRKNIEERYDRKRANTNVYERTQNKTEDKTKDKTNTTSSDDEDSNTREKSVVITAYMDKINATPSERCITELLHYQSKMGTECCLRAIDIALDAKKTSWNYIRAILQNKHEHGVKCLADWDKLEDQRKNGGAAGGQTASGNTAGDSTQSRKWNIQSADLG